MWRLGLKWAESGSRSALTFLFGPQMPSPVRSVAAKTKTMHGDFISQRNLPSSTCREFFLVHVKVSSWATNRFTRRSASGKSFFRPCGPRRVF